MKSRNAESKLTTYDDGKFVRTAIVVTDTSSIDVLNEKGERIGQVNLFTQEGRNILMVDVIDVEDRYTDRRAIGFYKGTPKHVKAGKVVAAHFEKPQTEPIAPEDFAPVTSPIAARNDGPA